MTRRRIEAAGSPIPRWGRTLFWSCVVKSGRRDGRPEKSRTADGRWPAHVTTLTGDAVPPGRAADVVASRRDRPRWYLVDESIDWDDESRIVGDELRRRPSLRGVATNIAALVFTSVFLASRRRPFDVIRLRGWLLELSTRSTGLRVLLPPQLGEDPDRRSICRAAS